MTPDAPAPRREMQGIRMQYTADRSLCVITFVQTDLRSPTVIRMLEADLFALPEQLRSKRLIVDFQGVTVAPTAILGLTLQLVVDAKSKEIAVRICGLAPVIRKAFDLLNARGLVPLFDTRKEAMTADWEKKGWWPF